MMNVFVCLGGGACAALVRMEPELLLPMPLALGLLVRKYWDLAAGLLLEPSKVDAFSLKSIVFVL